MGAQLTVEEDRFITLLVSRNLLKGATYGNGLVQCAIAHDRGAADSLLPLSATYLPDHRVASIIAVEKETQGTRIQEIISHALILLEHTLSGHNGVLDSDPSTLLSNGQRHQGNTIILEDKIRRLILPCALVLVKFSVQAIIRNAGVDNSGESARRLWGNNTSGTSMHVHEVRNASGNTTTIQKMPEPLLGRLLYRCCDYIARAPVTCDTVRCHIECVHLLLECCGTALYREVSGHTEEHSLVDTGNSPRFHSPLFELEDYFYKLLLTSDALRGVVLRLLQWLATARGSEGVVHGGAIPSGAMSTLCEPDLFYQAAVPRAALGGDAMKKGTQTASSTSNTGWLSWMGRTSVSSMGSDSAPPTRMVSASAVLYTSALQLLVVLLYSPVPFSVLPEKGNSAMTVLTTLRDGEPVSLVALTRALLRDSPARPQCLLILYALLHHHRTYFSFLLTDTTMRPLLLEMVLMVLQMLIRSSVAVNNNKNSIVDAKLSSVTSGLFSWILGKETNNFPVAGSEDAQIDIYADLVATNSATKLSLCFTFHLCATLLVIFSQDLAVNNALFGSWGADEIVQRKEWKWVTGAVTKVGTLWIVVLCKSLVRALSMHYYGASQLLIAALLNAAPFVHHIDSCAAQKLTHLLSVSMKRLSRVTTEMTLLERKARAIASSDDAKISSHIDDEENAIKLPDVDTSLASSLQSTDASQSFDSSMCSLPSLAPVKHPLQTDSRYHDRNTECRVTLEVVAGLAEAITAAIGVSDKRNYSLFYELLYNQPTLVLRPVEPTARFIKHHPNASAYVVTDEQLAAAHPHVATSVQRVMKPLTDVVAQVEVELASVSINQSPEQILDLIRKVVGNSRATILAAENQLLKAQTAETPAEVLSPPVNATLNTSTATGEGGTDGRSMAPCLELVYLYDEAEDSSGFFWPYVWSLLTSCEHIGNLFWHPDPAQLPLLREVDDFELD